MSKQAHPLVVVEFDHTPMAFRDDGWFNATVAAEKFGKQPRDWLRLHETEEYMRALAEHLNLAFEPAYSSRKPSAKVSGGKCDFRPELNKIKGLVMTKRGSPDTGGGTWLHPKLAVAFARWLNVRFGIWCDQQIDGLLRGQHPHHDWLRLRHEAASSNKVMCAMLKLTREEAGKASAPHHFSNEQRLVNWALTGTFQAVDREALPPDTLSILAKLEEHNAVLIGRGVDYRLRKPALETLARALLLRALPSEAG